MINRITLLALCLVISPAHALTLDSTPVPGGIAVITLPDDTDPTSTRYREKKILVTDIDGKKTAVVGLSLGTKPGRHFLHARNHSRCSCER